MTETKIYDIAAEGGVLGSLILDRKNIELVRKILPGGECFHKPEHRTLYDCFLTISGESIAEKWDIILLQEALKKHHALTAVGGVDYLVDLANSVPTSANAEYYARIVRQKFISRTIESLGQSISEAASDNPLRMRELQTELARLIIESELTACANDNLIMRPVSDYESKQINWFWPDRFPLGMLSILAGIQGGGKSFLMCYMAAVASRGLQWADCLNLCRPMDVAIFTDEESISYALRPRLEACGADLNRVFVLDCLKTADGQIGFFDLQSRLALLDNFLAERPECKLVFFDSLAGFLGDVDGNSNTDVRVVLSPLVELAERRGCAVIGILHLNKKPDLQGVQRISGATSFSAIARAVWLIAKEPDTGGRLFLPVKNNYSDPTGLRFRIINSAVAFDSGAIDTTLEEALSPPRKPKDADTLEQATDWLRDRLEGNPPVAAKDLYEAGRAEGFNEKMLRRAKEKLACVKVDKVGFRGNFVWSWAGLGAKDEIPV